MAVERVDYYSDEDYNAALFAEEMSLRDSLREQEEEAQLLMEAEQNNRKGENMSKKFDVIVIQKQELDGLKLPEIAAIYALLDADEGYPIEVEGTHAIAQGFITPRAADAINYEMDRLYNGLIPIIDNMALEVPSNRYEISGLSVCMVYDIFAMLSQVGI